MDWILSTDSRLYYAARQQPPRIWNARFRLLASQRNAMHSALQHPRRNCSAAPDFMPWAWQTTMRSILVLRHCKIAPRVWSGRKSSPLDLEDRAAIRTRRVFSPCWMERKSHSLRSVMSGLPRKLIGLIWTPQSPPRVHRQTSSFVWFTGELKTTRTSLTNNANSPAG